MNNQFDQLTKSVAQSVTRRQALRRFGLGLATIALAGFGFNALATAQCRASGQMCNRKNTGSSCSQCCSGIAICDPDGDTSDHCVCQ